MSVFVLGSDGRPIMPCSEKRARLLLERNRARVVKVFPFTIQLRDRYFNLLYCKKLYSVKWSNCRIVQRNSGYSYTRKEYSFLEFRDKFLTIGRL